MKTPDQAFFSDLSMALRLLFENASATLGSDCLMHAILALEVLRPRYPDAELVAGYAAWRLGSDPGAVVAHHPLASPVADEQGGVLFHAWIQLLGRRWIFDPTVYQLPSKLALIDAADGSHTPCDMPEAWSNGLLVKRRDTTGWPSVRDGLTSGGCCYIPEPGLTALVRSHPDSRADAADIAALTNVLECVSSGTQLVLVGPFGTAVVSA